MRYPGALNGKRKDTSWSSPGLLTAKASAVLLPGVRLSQPQGDDRQESIYLPGRRIGNEFDRVFPFGAGRQQGIEECYREAG
jgi:hypothetical protein